LAAVSPGFVGDAGESKAELCEDWEWYGFCRRVGFEFEFVFEAEDAEVDLGMGGSRLIAVASLGNEPLAWAWAWARECELA
jgi:hypothetical protein